MKYGKEITREICEIIAQGMSRTDACSLANISYETFTVWMEKPEFSEAIKRAEVKCKRVNLAIIQRAALRNWQAAAWILERKWSSEFALRQKHELTGKGGGPIQTKSLDLSHVSTAVLEKLAGLDDGE